MKSPDKIAPLSIDKIGWASFLGIWSDQITHWIKNSSNFFIDDEIAMEVLIVGYLGYSGASEVAIAKAEATLGLQLPPSYREFLKVSNGWRQVRLRVMQGRLFSVQEIDLLKNKEPDLVEAWLNAMPEDYQDLRTPDEEYFSYGPDQDPGSMRDEYLATAIAVSEFVEDGVCLLNPMIIAPDGEWEAWIFSHKFPGALRYRSFQDLMEAEYVRIMGVVQRYLSGHATTTLQSPLRIRATRHPYQPHMAGRSFRFRDRRNHW